VGPVGPGDPRADISALEAVANVHLPGARPYRELPEVLRGAAAAMIPYAHNPLTASIFPMKVYEYLAAGLPVAATRLPSLEGVEGVSLADDAAGMASALDELLAADTPERRVDRSRRAAAHSWEARLDEIESAVSALGPYRAEPRE
jgi:glycosyltransferase involved in cell wall biosynthesis